MKEITVRLLLAAAVLMCMISRHGGAAVAGDYRQLGGKDHLFLLHADGKGKDCTVSEN